MESKKIKSKRKDLNKQSVEDRLKNWNEVYLELSKEDVIEQSGRCLDCGVAFCQSNFGCPVSNVIPEWNSLVQQGNWEKALENLHSTNNFPEFTGRLCPAPCESACVLGINDDPVSIKATELSIIETGFRSQKIKPIIARKKTGFKVAIIGSGPAGLAAAQQLARSGHAVTVFERNELIGGLLRFGIPDFKLEKNLIDRRIHQMEKEGVRFLTKKAVGIDITFDELKANFDAICIAIGSEIGRDLNIEGRNLDGIHMAMDYLCKQNRVNHGTDSSLEISAKGLDVIIIGGGDTGSDCVGTALRQGAKSVTQLDVIPQPPQTRNEKNHWPHYPMIFKVSHAHEEGGSRNWGLSTKKFNGTNNRVSSLTAERVNFNGGGLRKEPGSDINFPADLVILAIGFSGPKLDLLSKIDGLSYEKNGLINVNSSFMTSIPGVFAGGDAKRGASLIVWAISEGRKMADGVNKFLSTLSRKNL